MTPPPDKSQDGNESIPPELKPYYGPDSSLTRRRIFWVGRLILVILVVVVLVTLGSIWLHSHKVGEKTAKTNTTSQQANNKNQGAKPSGGSANTSEKPSSNKSSGSTAEPTNGSVSGGSSEANSSGVATTNQIPNTGPGTTAIMLAGAAVIIGAILNYSRQLARLNRNK